MQPPSPSRPYPTAVGTPEDASLRTIGVVACAGDYPKMVIQAAKKAGVRVVCAGMKGAVRGDIPPLCDLYRSFRVGQVELPLAYMKAAGVTDLIFAGQIKPSFIFTMRPDATARAVMAKLLQRNAHSIFGAACALLEERGFRILPATTFMEEHMPGEGLLAGPAPSAEQQEDALYGMEAAKRIAALDIGQSLIVHGRSVLCVEAFKGTNECIRQGGGKPYPATLCKVTKPGHDMRFDVPCLGLTTVQHCLRANISHIVFEAHRTILFQKEQIIAFCNRHGITLQALTPPSVDNVDVLPASSAPDDERHARALADRLEQIGIGHSAVVCDGVVIVVEDSEGPLKCIRRAHAYMKRLRLARAVRWLGGLVLGRRLSPPRPLTMAGTDSFAATDAVKKAAKKAHIRLHAPAKSSPHSPS